MKIEKVDQFIEKLWSYYTDHARDLPWRYSENDGTFDPYKILVSELMLQQTQVARVVPKFLAFIAKYPDQHSVAQADLSKILKMWSGLGYNRRAKFLHQACIIIDQEFNGVFPSNKEDLVMLPGVGMNTAGAIMAYAYNQPALFIETNIRAVIIHHFFASDEHITDTQIEEVLALVLDQDNPREFYWAMMDYGTHVKASIGNVNKQSKHYSKQSTFEGSARQIRGQVLKQLAGAPQSFSQLMVAIEDTRLLGVLEKLQAEKLVSLKKEIYYLG